MKIYPAKGMRRFFFHYHRQKKKMSVHFDGKCHVVESVGCLVPCETHYNKRQPFLVMRGFCNEVLIEKDLAVIR
jgi:hypothetical protein